MVDSSRWIVGSVTSQHNKAIIGAVFRRPKGSPSPSSPFFNRQNKVALKGGHQCSEKTKCRNCRKTYRTESTPLWTTGMILSSNSSQSFLETNEYVAMMIFSRSPPTTSRKAGESVIWATTFVRMQKYIISMLSGSFGLRIPVRSLFMMRMEPASSAV